MCTSVTRVGGAGSSSKKIDTVWPLSLGSFLFASYRNGAEQAPLSPLHAFSLRAGANSSLAAARSPKPSPGWSWLESRRSTEELGQGWEWWKVLCEEVDSEFADGVQDVLYVCVCAYTTIICMRSKLWRNVETREGGGRKGENGVPWSTPRGVRH